MTDRFVKSATTGGRKSPIFMDDEVIEFGVEVRETGRKSFTLDYMFRRAAPATLHQRFPGVFDEPTRTRQPDQARA